MDEKDFLIRKVGEKVLNTRKEKRVTQDELSKLSGASQMTVQRVETATGAARVDNLIGMIHGLGLKVSDVFREAELLMESQNGKKHLSRWDIAEYEMNKLGTQEKEWLAEIILKVVSRPGYLNQQIGIEKSVGTAVN